MFLMLSGVFFSNILKSINTRNRQQTETLGKTIKTKNEEISENLVFPIILTNPKHLKQV